MTVLTVVFAAIFAVGAGLMLSSAAFAAGCLITVSLDVTLVRVATHRAHRELARGHIDDLAPTLMLGGRLLAKGVLLAASVFVPDVLGFAGTLAGAVAFDITLFVAGSIVAAARMLRHRGKLGARS